MKDHYLESINLIERLHKSFLDVIKIELDRLNIYDINNIQSLVIYNLGKGQISVTELLNRGYYLGSNASYNLKKMLQNGYIQQDPSPHDRRSVVVSLTEKGVELYKKLDVALSKHLTRIEQIHPGFSLEDLNSTLQKLEILWTSIISHPTPVK